MMGVHLDEVVIERILAAAEREMARFASDGKAVFDAPAHVVAATRP